MRANRLARQVVHADAVGRRVLRRHVLDQVQVAAVPRNRVEGKRTLELDAAADLHPARVDEGECRRRAEGLADVEVSRQQERPAVREQALGGSVIGDERDSPDAL
jgi:hypothetical protein